MILLPRASPAQNAHSGLVKRLKRMLFPHLYLLLALAVPQALFANNPTTLPETLSTPTEVLAMPREPAETTPEYVVIRPSDQVTYSSETAASILQIPVREGSKFKKGDLLLQMDCRLQKAELAKAQAQSKAADMANKSALKLKTYGFISELEITKASSDAAIAKAEVDKLLTTVDKCTIIAPFTGAVSDLMVNPLETVKPGDPLLKIVNTENLEFEIQIPSLWLSWLKVGSQFKVHVHETNQDVVVDVVRIDPEIESVSRTVKITGVLDQPDQDLLPGMTGQASFSNNPNLMTPGK